MEQIIKTIFLIFFIIFILGSSITAFIGVPFMMWQESRCNKFDYELYQVIPKVYCKNNNKIILLENLKQDEKRDK